MAVAALQVLFCPGTAWLWPKQMAHGKQSPLHSCAALPAQWWQLNMPLTTGHVQAIC